MRGLCHSLAVVAAVGMLLPPGWCCVVPAQAAEVAQHVASLPACCAARQAASASPSPAGPSLKQAPLPGVRCCSTTRTGMQCCCAKGRASLNAKERVSPDNLAATIVLPACVPSIVSQLGQPAPAVRPPGDLQSLLCCWRC